MKRTFILLLLLTALVSCTHYNQIKVESIDLANFRMESSTKAYISFNVKVDNPTDKNIMLVGMDGVLKKDMERFAVVSLVDTVSVPAASVNVVKVESEVSLCDPLSLLSMGLNIKSWSVDSFTASGELVLKPVNGCKRTLKLKDTKVESIINMFK